MRLNFGREGFIFFSFYRFQKIYPDNTIIEFPVILNQHKRKQKKRFPVKLIRFGKPRDFLDYREILLFLFINVRFCYNGKMKEGEHNGENKAFKKI